MVGRTRIKWDDNDTVSTTELLDLIEADVDDAVNRLGGGRNANGGRVSNGTAGPSSATSFEHGGDLVIGSGEHDTMISSLDGGDPFSVRLKPAHRRRQAAADGVPCGIGNDDGEDDDFPDDMSGFDTYRNRRNQTDRGSSRHATRKTTSRRGREPPPASRKKRQRMPLGGGYGGMFDAAAAAPREPASPSQEGASDVSRDSDSSLTSALSFASRFFTVSKKLRRRGGSSVGSNPYSASSRSDAAPPSSRHGALLVGLARCYLALPFRLRYFVQMLALVGVFMLASLNYFIAMDRAGVSAGQGPPPSSARAAPPGLAALGGGAPARHLPRLRVRDPWKFLHHDFRPNELLEAAVEKFRRSARFGLDGLRSGGAGPFKYGWKSMPRQIYHSFSTGLSDDAQTIEYASAARAEGHGDDGARDPARGTVAYVFPVTTCAGTGANVPLTEDAFRDVALLLRAAIHAHSWRNPAAGSAYDYAMRAVLHPRAKQCGDVDRSLLLQELGYDVVLREAPVTQDDVTGSEYLQDHVGRDEGAGELADLIGLHAYELEEYDAVALVDHDTLILGPIDEAVDLIINSQTGEEGGGDGGGDGGGGDRGEGNYNAGIEAVFLWEHLSSLAEPGTRVAVVNLSFLLLRPSRSTFKDLVARYKDAPFDEVRGWGHLGRGPFPGWMTLRGLLTYYYDEVASAARVEVNRCAFGNPGAARDEELVLITNEGRVECNGKGTGGAGDAEEHGQCRDCGRSPLREVVVADLSNCRAPWMCGVSDDDETTATPDALSSGLCRQFQQAWFRARLQMEDVHPQLEKGSGTLCIDGQYQPMVLLKPSDTNK